MQGSKEDCEKMGARMGKAGRVAEAREARLSRRRERLLVARAPLADPAAVAVLARGLSEAGKRALLERAVGGAGERWRLSAREALAAGAAPVGRRGRSLLDERLANKEWGLALDLAKAGAAASRDPRGLGPLARAIADRAPRDLLEALLESGHGVDDAVGGGQTPLFAAWISKQADVASWLIERGADARGARERVRRLWVKGGQKEAPWQTSMLDRFGAMAQRWGEAQALEAICEAPAGGARAKPRL